MRGGARDGAVQEWIEIKVANEGGVEEGVKGGVVEVSREEDGASLIWPTGVFDPGGEAPEGGGSICRAVDIDVYDKCPAEGGCKGLEVVVGEAGGFLEP